MLFSAPAPQLKVQVKAPEEHTVGVSRLGTWFDGGAKSHQHAPVSYPDKRITTCTAAAKVWLTDEEEKLYLRGERIFTLSGRPPVQVS
jgi:hypothetical protein